MRRGGASHWWGLNKECASRNGKKTYDSCLGRETREKRGSGQNTQNCTSCKKLNHKILRCIFTENMTIFIRLFLPGWTSIEPEQITILTNNRV